jgi:hypothetical protein
MLSIAYSYCRADQVFHLAKIAILAAQDFKPELAQRRSNISRIVDGIGRRAFGISAVADDQRDARLGVDFSGGLPSTLSAEGRRGRVKTQGRYDHRKQRNK